MSGVVMYLPSLEGETMGQVFDQLGIDITCVGNVFLNGRLVPRSIYAITLGYQLVAERPLVGDEFLAVPVHAGDRVGIFPRNMSAVVV